MSALTGRGNDLTSSREHPTHRNGLIRSPLATPIVYVYLYNSTACYVAPASRRAFGLPHDQPHRLEATSTSHARERLACHRLLASRCQDAAVCATDRFAEPLRPGTCPTPRL